MHQHHGPHRPPCGHTLNFNALEEPGIVHPRRADPTEIQGIQGIQGAQGGWERPEKIWVILWLWLLTYYILIELYYCYYYHCYHYYYCYYYDCYWVNLTILELLGGFNQPLWKMMEFVRWDDEKNDPKHPKHQKWWANMISNQQKLRFDHVWVGKKRDATAHVHQTLDATHQEIWHWPSQRVSNLANC